MRRILLSALLILALLAALCAASAEGDYIYYGDMTVVNCNEWVSLRDVPGTGGNRLAKVPLGAIVTEAEWWPLCDRFIYCCYEGQYGYILSEYLERADDNGQVILRERRNGLDVFAMRSYFGDSESLYVSCTDLSGALLWEYRTEVSDPTELEPLEAFFGGTIDDPLVMIYSTEEGLTALDSATGKARWCLSRDDVNLGAGISYATALDGTVYIGGYYGPDPVAISAEGEVLWQADSGDPESYWLYEIELVDAGVAAHYDMFKGGESSGWILYGWDGSLLRAVSD